MNALARILTAIFAFGSISGPMLSVQALANTEAATQNSASPRTTGNPTPVDPKKLSAEQEANTEQGEPAVDEAAAVDAAAVSVAIIALIMSLLVSVLMAGIILGIVRKWLARLPKQHEMVELPQTHRDTQPTLEQHYRDAPPPARQRGAQSFQHGPAAGVNQSVYAPPQPQRPSPTADVERTNEAANRDGFNWSTDDRREPWPTSTSPNLEPIVPQPTENVGQRAAVLARRLTQLAGDPALTSGLYDQLIAEYGELHALQAPEGEGGHWRVIDGGNDRNRRLSVLVFSGTTQVAIIPSLRFLRDFSQTYKDKLEAGDDVRALFECRVDGTGLLQVQQLATAQLYSGDLIAEIVRGELGGFVR
jgi:hypothetical protein